jgi:hypothetical protein
MIRLKKAASAIKDLSQAKPTTQQSDTDDSSSVADEHDKMKASAGQRHKPDGSQRPSKKAAPQSRHSDVIDGNEDGDDNDGNDDNAPVEEDEEEVDNEDNDGQGNDEEEEEEEEEEANAEGSNTKAASSKKPNTKKANAEEAKANEEEEEGEGDPYKQAETKMLIAKTKLLLLKQKKKKDGGLRRGDARSEQHLISKVQELRDWLARETKKQEAAGDKEKKKKKKSKPSKKAKPDPNKLWAIHGIIKETTYHYLVVWKGEDEDGQPWDDSWVAKGEVNASAKHDWAALRREVASHKKEKRKEWEALEEARKKAED